MENTLLRQLPSVDELIKSPAFNEAVAAYSRALIVDAVREALAEFRLLIVSGKVTDVKSSVVHALVLEKIHEITSSSIVRAINATGTILHTNLGRAVLCDDAVEALTIAASGHVNLEIDLATGERGLRDGLVEGLIKRLTGAEACAVVNNNAAAVFITLNTLAESRDVVISRGELIEIGGSFRLPEIIKKSGCVMREVGTTNRTHPDDYEKAVTKDTAVFFKAHRSNFIVSGFTSEVGLAVLVSIGKRHGVPVVEDLGSGALIDLTKYGLPKEPIVGERLSTGADVVTFSGDKLLGGPQCGIIAGSQAIIDRINKNPLKRVLRADKLTLSALSATLRLYLNEETLSQNLPALRAMTRSVEEIGAIAEKASVLLRQAFGADYKVDVKDGESVIGGGALPGYTLRTKVVLITHKTFSAEKIFKAFLGASPPVLGRIKDNAFVLDMRTVQRAEDVVIGAVKLL
ncbi:L-seryl-tRNA(Sec) selenium transferase [bacterium]|nr:MAG: L-seryl-tRNA(Sec) selenium transferase [bacterium]